VPSSKHDERTNFRLKLETVLFSIYYPADKTNQSTKASPKWVQNIDLISVGIAAGTGGSVDAQLVKIGLQALAGSAIIPVFTDVPIINATGYPVFVFSHGDTTLPEWYSHYLGSIAADGNVVAAITHRDGSNAGSIVEINGLPSRNVTYITPDQVSPAVNTTGLAMLERTFRQAEVDETIRVLKAINNGQGAEVYQKSSRGDGQTLADWQGRLNFDNLVLGGHSFGATSALDSIQHRETSEYTVRAGLVLDPGKESGPLSTNIQVPILIPDSDAWSSQQTEFFGANHFDVVKSIAETSLNASDAGWFLTLLGTAHTSITDAGLIAGSSLLSLFDNGAANATLDPATAIEKYVNVSTEFFRYLKNGTTSGILANSVTDPIYTVRQPNSSTPGNESSYWEIHVAPIAKYVK
jgi:platelet-activating factor acetylhydrolase